MSKWADYVITRVRYDALETHIEEVEVADDNDSSIGSKRVEARQTVISKLKQRKTYVTVTPSKATPGSWDRGAPVEIVVLNNREYIKTKPDKTASDNLGELQRF